MEQRKAANNWLIQLQESVYAWDVAHQLLTSSMESTHHLFGAQTIQTKIRHYFDELPLEMHIPVRDSIMNHCERLCSTAGWPVINQLCLALADLALQMDNWDTVVQDCINRYGTQYKHVLILLSILMVLPEEIGNRYLKLGENRRTKWRQLFEQQCSGILQLLSSCLSYWGEDGEIQIRVFECLGSWITLKTFSPDELANSSLMLAPFKTLYPAKVPEKLHEVASDCICSALFICDDVSSFAPLATFLQNQVNQLSPLFIASLDIEEPDRANSLARIFTEMAESFLFYIVHYPDTSHGSMHTLDLLLMCADHYDYEIIDMTLSVWYRLAEMLVKIQDQETNLRFKPYIARLTSSLIKHCQLNEDLGKVETPFISIMGKPSINPFMMNIN
jgi:transportin-3